MTAFESAVLDALRSLGTGEVVTYGEVAEMAGYPGRARAVGRILARTEEDVPWWRVVGAGGRLISPTSEAQRVLLHAEGHQIANGRITLPGAQVTPPPPSQATTTGYGAMAGRIDEIGDLLEPWSRPGPTEPPVQTAGHHTSRHASDHFGDGLLRGRRGSRRR